MLLTRRAGPPLRDHVDLLWYYEGDETCSHRERVLPNGRFQLIMGPSTGCGFVSGLRSAFVDIAPGAIRSMMGVVFRPGGARAFFQEPAIDFYNKAVPLDDVWPRRMKGLCRGRQAARYPQQRLQALEAVLQSALTSRALHPAVLLALRELLHMPGVRTVRAVTRDTGLSRRRLSHLFREEVGMTPKRYSRLLRFRDVVKQIRTGGRIDWLDVTIAGGYYDQAHMSHEFREFSGFSPGSFLDAERPYENHVRIER